MGHGPPRLPRSRERAKPPVGTLYHRFGSRDGVLAAAWLRALEGFQRCALAAAAHPDPLEAAVAMASSQIGFAREQPEDARLLLTLRRDDLLDAAPDNLFRARLEAINAPLETTIAALAKALARAGRRARIGRCHPSRRRSAQRHHPSLRARPGRLPAWLDHDVAAATRRLLEQ